MSSVRSPATPCIPWVALRTESICSHPSILSFNFGMLHLKCEVRHSQRSDYRGIRRVVYRRSSNATWHASKPSLDGHRAQTVPRQAGAINVVDHPRLSDLPERNLTYPSPSHLSVHAHQAQFSAHRSPINSHCRAYTIQIRKPDTQHDGAWGLTPRCLLRQLV